MHPGPAEGDPKPLRRAQALAVTKNNSSNPSTSTENVQKPSTRELFRGGFASMFRSTPGGSTHASTPTPSLNLVNFIKSGTITSTRSTKTPPLPPARVERDTNDNDTTVTAPNDRIGPPTLGKLLPSDLWTQAYDGLSIEYKLDLGPVDKRDNNQQEKIEEVKKLLERAMQAKSENIASQWKLRWGSKEVNVREKAEKLVSWIVKFKEVVDIAVQYDPVHAALPWAGMRLILNFVISEQQNLQHAIIAMERITFLVSRCTIYEKLYFIECEVQAPDATKIAIDELRKALVILYMAILRALCLCIRVFKGNILDKLRSPDAIFEEITALDAPEAGVDSAVRTLENCYNSYTRTQHKEAFEKLTMLLRDFSTVVSRIGETVTAVYERIQETERVAILQWFSVIPYQGHHDLASEGRVAGTGQWLFQRKEFRLWQQSERSEVLWLHGIPGAGKTKLVSATVDYLRERKIAYFYCKRDEEVRRERQTILLSLIKQLACPPNKTAIYSEVLQAYKNEQKDPSARKHLPVDACHQLLSNLLDYYDHPLIVLDALDECSKESCGSILSDLLSILTKSKRPVKAFISSRHSLDIEDRLQHFPNVCIEAKDNAEDIEKYVKSALNKKIEDKELLRGCVSMELRRHIEEVLQRDANGMFLWVDFQIRELCNQPRERDIRARLGKLPKDLTSVYNEIMNSIMCQPDSRLQIAIRVLKWMVVSLRPLAPDELTFAAELDSAILDSTVVPELTIDQVIHFCGGLLLWDKQLDVIRFSHLSVQEYLETESMNKYWDITDAHHLVMEACLWILQCSQPPESVPLYSYAALHWFRHCRSYQDLLVQAAVSNKPSKHTLDIQSLRKFLPSFDKPTASYEEWVHSLSTHGDVIKRYPHYYESEFLRDLPVYPAFGAAFGGLEQLVNWLWLAKDLDIHVTNNRGAPLLQYAIVSGNIKLVERIITMGADINFTGSADQTALMVAAEGNYSRIASILLDRGADINIAVGREFGTALNCAIQGEHMEVVSLLLERGADINIPGGRFGTALGFAAIVDRVELVSLLLERGADVNVVSGMYTTALGCAAAGGGVESVSLLLDRGADINIPVVDNFTSNPDADGGKWWGQHYGTILGVASWRGHMEILSLLLQRGSDINAIGGMYGTALGCAAANGRLEVVPLLLEQGADINAIGGMFGTALCNAALNGEVGSVSLLLERGADTNVIGGIYTTALGCAAAGGSVESVSLLLDRGADISVPVGGNFGTVLGVAAHWGQMETVSLLLERGVNINTIGGDFGTTLGCAAFEGHVEMVSLLLERGADINIVGGDFGTALGCAAFKGNVEIVSLLLERGADINIVGGDFGTALGCAALKGTVEFVSLLLEQGANINTIGGKFGTALGCAVSEGREEVVTLLLERGADINVIGGDYGTALGCAAVRERVKSIPLFLDRGADINTIGGDFGTALGCAAAQGCVESISLLLDGGANINTIGGLFGTALGWAAAVGSLSRSMESVLLLLDRGADINVVSGDFGTPLAIAAWRGHVEVVSLLLERGADVNVVGGLFGTTLGSAVSQGEVGLVPLLLERGADINAVGGKLGTALGVAAYKGKVEPASQLLELGADVNIRGGEYGTALGTAASFGHIDIVKLLLEHGAKPDLTNADGMTAHALAERGGHLDIVQFLDSWVEA